jgi:hypothetical protein
MVVLFSYWGCTAPDDSSTESDAVVDIPDTSDLNSVIEEEWGMSPTSVTFNDVEVGGYDVQIVTVTNQSSTIQSIYDIVLSDSVETVRFTTDFIINLYRPDTRWIDTDGDGQTFEVREQPIVLGTGESYDIEIQLHPEGGIDECPDPPPAACGSLWITGEYTSLSVPLYLPR